MRAGLASSRLLDLSDMIKFLKATPLFKGIGEKELESILPLLKVRVYEKGALILQEGEKGDAFYLIKTGSVEVLKKETSNDSLHRVGTLRENDWFGEMAFLGEGTRQSSVRALEHVEAIAIPTSSLLKQGETNPVFSKLSINFAKKISGHLQQANVATVQSIEKQLTLTKTHDQIGRLIVYLFILLTLFFYALRITEELHPVTWIASFFVSFLIVGLGIFSWVLVKQSHFPLKFYGVTLKNGWRHAKEALLWTAPLLLAMLVVKWFLVTFVHKFKDLGVIGISTHGGLMLSIFDPSKIEREKEHFWVALAIYIVLVPIQEFIARGIMQGCLYNFFVSSHRVVLSIVMSNLLFGLFHGFKTISFSIVACLIGVFWGWIYHKQRSLVGPSVSHALVGIWGIGILNYQSILVF